MEKTDIAIVGAGAAGLMAACFAPGESKLGRRRVVVFERNDVPGRKLSITGKGRCNITNNADIENFMQNIPGNGKFLFSAFSAMSNTDIVEFFESNGVAVELERGGRYFTRSGSAKEVTRALTQVAENRGTLIYKNTRVLRVLPIPPTVGHAPDGYRFRLFLAGGADVLAKSVVIATGGISYPATGSTGDGYKLAESLGHTVVTPGPSLIPLETRELWAADLQGLTLKNVTLDLFSPDGKNVFSKLGELLFTHFGISGPLVLSGSRSLRNCGFAGCRAGIDLKPALSHEKLTARITRDFLMYERKSLRNAMRDLLPQRLIPVVISESLCDPDSKSGTLGKARVNALVKTIKSLNLTIMSARPTAEAIVTVGGVKTTEINPSTMESKLVNGLYFCGEVIDVDAYTGGFNLSIAFSSGYVAGRSAYTDIVTTDSGAF